MKIIGYATATIATMAFNTMLWAFTVCKIWEWFISPAFGLQKIGIATAIGLSIITGLFKTVPDKKQEEYGEMLQRSFVTCTARSVIALLFGWIVTLFM